MSCDTLTRQQGAGTSAGGVLFPAQKRCGSLKKPILFTMTSLKSHSTGPMQQESYEETEEGLESKAGKYWSIFLKHCFDHVMSRPISPCPKAFNGHGDQVQIQEDFQPPNHQCFLAKSPVPPSKVVCPHPTALPGSLTYSKHCDPTWHFFPMLLFTMRVPRHLHIYPVCRQVEFYPFYPLQGTCPCPPGP